MENSAHPEKGLPKISTTSDDTIQKLMNKRADLEEKVHRTSEKLTKLIQESEKLLHPEKRSDQP